LVVWLTCQTVSLTEVSADGITAPKSRTASPTITPHATSPEKSTSVARQTSPERPKGQRARSVRWDLPSKEPTPEFKRKSKKREGDEHSESSRHAEGGRRKHRRHSEDSRQKYQRAGSPSNESDETVVLPDRFDEQGRRKPDADADEDPLAEVFESIIRGRNPAGKVIGRTLETLFSGGKGR